MEKKRVLELVKETQELDSINEAKNYLKGLDTLIEAIGEELEERTEGATDKARIGDKLILEKKFSKGGVERRNPKTKEIVGVSEDKFVVKAKIK